jgi:plasmid stabilization system protein ParE
MAGKLTSICRPSGSSRGAPLSRYPYKIFYRVTGDTVEILHIRHAARQPRDAAPPGTPD